MGGLPALERVDARLRVRQQPEVVSVHDYHPEHHSHVDLTIAEALIGPDPAAVAAASAFHKHAAVD